MKRILFVCSFAGLIASASSAQRFPFMIPGDDASESITSRRALLDAPAGKYGFVRVEADHFFAGDHRIRFWGFNTCFAANFPSHQDADFLAPHLAKLGVNAIRFHHMDTQASPSGIWGKVDAEGNRPLDPEMVDRLDYFLARLHEHGIYANINLHVGRTLLPEEGFPVLEGAPWWAGYNKWVMYYDKSVQQKLKEYCRDLLTHENPYRNGLRRVDDPGIAMVEMMNENYFSRQGYSLAGRLPQRFQNSLASAWNHWLGRKYPSTAQLQKAWYDSQPPMGDELFPVATWKSDFQGWELNKPAAGLPCEFGVTPPPGLGDSAGAIRIAPLARSEQDYEQQLNYSGLSTRQDQPLTLTYWVRSDEPRTHRVEFSTAAGGRWRELGLFESLESTPQWQQVTRVIFPSESVEKEAALRLNLGNSEIPIELAAVSLRQGAFAAPLPADQSLEAGSVVIPSALSPVQAHADMKQFMVDTEIAWVRELKSFLTDDLGVKVPIAASQLNYHTPEVNEQWNDFVDLHNYWHHPLFPSDSPWDRQRWTVGNEPMEADPSRSDWPANSLLMRVPWRVAGKPMTLSEWNYPQPSFYSAGCVPMAAMLGGLQDWDAIFFFDYDSASNSTRDWKRNAATNFFDFNGEPVKLATFSVFANVFLRGDLKPLRRQLVAPTDDPLPGSLGLQYRLATSASKDAIPEYDPPDTDRLVSPGQTVSWKSDPPKYGTVKLDTPATQGVWGTIGDGNFEASDLSFSVETIEPNYGLLIATSVDGKPIATTDRILLLAATHSENQNMGWNDERTSVGTDWGEGPTQVLGIEALVRLPRIKDCRVFALSGKGQRKDEVPVTQSDQTTEFRISAKHRTLWYEVSAGR